MKTNYHTHTTFCDGKSTAEEMVLSAMRCGFDTLGFSSHAMFPFSSDWHMKVEEIDLYCGEINRLKEKYADKILIKLGFEADYIAPITDPTFENYRRFKPEFIIGSVHFITTQDGIFPVDESLRTLKDGIKKYFQNDAKKAVQSYFDIERQMLRKGGFSILGHADLITKFQEKEKLFDESEIWYKNELKATADEIKRSGVVAEINTGAISRGYRTVPYPSEYFLSLLQERNVPVTINSDAHHADSLDTAFSLAEELARKVGYKEFKTEV